MYVAILFHLLGELTLMGTSTRGWFLLALLLLQDHIVSYVC